MMKSCSTCRWHQKDLECFVDHCSHPSLEVFDQVKGSMMPPIRIALNECKMTLWERPRTFTEFIFGKRKNPEVRQ